MVFLNQHYFALNEMQSVLCSIWKIVRCHVTSGKNICSKNYSMVREGEKRALKRGCDCAAVVVSAFFFCGYCVFDSIFKFCVVILVDAKKN